MNSRHGRAAKQAPTPPYDVSRETQVVVGGSKPQPSLISLRQRLDLFEASRSKPAVSAKTANASADSTPAPASVDPTTAFFNRLERAAVAASTGHYGASRDDAKRQKKTSPQDSSSSPMFIDSRREKLTPRTESVQAVYAGKADELETTVASALDKTRETLELQVKGLQKADDAFVRDVQAHQALVSEPLYELKFAMRTEKARKLGQIAADLEAEKDVVERAVSSLWQDYEELNCQIRPLCEHILEDDGSPAHDVQTQVQRLLRDAERELDDLAFATEKELASAEKDAMKRMQTIRDAMLEQRARDFDRTLGKRLRLG